MTELVEQIKSLLLQEFATDKVAKIPSMENDQEVYHAMCERETYNEDWDSKGYMANHIIEPTKGVYFMTTSEHCSQGDFYGFQKCQEVQRTEVTTVVYE
jgi:hypothetical protein